MENHKAGFVAILGKPNVGKSTLMNQLVGERLSIITSKAQTTRHRIMGIINGEDYQIVYSDTPGIIEPKYELQKAMMGFVDSSLEDADLILLVVEMGMKEIEESILEKLGQVGSPVFLVLNKVDLGDQEAVNEKMNYWREKFPFKDIIPVSALHGFNCDTVFDSIVDSLPVHPPFFAKDELTDKPERFFASEIIREKIFLNYQKEIPYSCEVAVTAFKEEEAIIRIRAEIYVERSSQKIILIGKGGQMLKKVGTEARKDMEEFFQKKVFLEQFVKVDSDWRKKVSRLKNFGYKN
ncbi:GTPase Era [Flexithrix dorotheae]|uniref:GTPase Era n=1 Tax=Flexithrix dorotheae TaxID=70993 RepID=UPI0003670978|nr:GTPase Era [Flexithrix dorotheae]